MQPAEKNIEKRVVIFSDNPGLARAVEISLSQRPTIRVTTHLLILDSHPLDLNGLHSSDLVIAAISSPETEPILLMVQKTLGGLMSAVPIIVISENPANQINGTPVFHLDFPFDSRQLEDLVNEILGSSEISWHCSF